MFTGVPVALADPPSTSTVSLFAAYGCARMSTVYCVPFSTSSPCDVNARVKCVSHVYQPPELLGSPDAKTRTK